jgi:hypothetical protein
MHFLVRSACRVDSKNSDGPRASLPPGTLAGTLGRQSIQCPVFGRDGRGSEQAAAQPRGRERPSCPNYWRAQGINPARGQYSQARKAVSNFHGPGRLPSPKDATGLRDYTHGRTVESHRLGRWTEKRQTFPKSDASHLSGLSTGGAGGFQEGLAASADGSRSPIRNRRRLAAGGCFARPRARSACSASGPSSGRRRTRTWEYPRCERVAPALYDSRCRRIRREAWG